MGKNRTILESKNANMSDIFKSKQGVTAEIIGKDLILKAPGGKIHTIVGAGLQASLDKKLAFKFTDGEVKAKTLLSHIDPEKMNPSSEEHLVATQGQQTTKTRKKREALDKELEEEKEKAQREKEAAEQERKMAQEAKESIQKVEETLQEYLARLNTKTALANMAQPEMEEVYTLNVQKELIPTVEGAYLSKNANRSSGLNNPAPNPKIDLKVTFTLDKESNSSGQENNLTRHDSPLLRGNTMPGAEVAIYHNGVHLTNMSADNKGNFKFAPQNLQNGPHLFLAQAKYKGNKSEAELLLFIKSSTEPPTFEVISDDIALKSDQDEVFLVNKVNTSIKGTAEKNTQVSIFVGDKKVGVAEVDEKGNWSYQFEANKLAQGDNEIKVVAEDQAKNTAEITRTINLDSIPPEAPSVALAKASQTHQTDPKITHQLNPTLEGKAEMGSKVALYLDGKLIKEHIPVDKEGHWSFSLDDNKAAKNHNVEVFATDERGNRSAAGRFNFEIDNDIGAFTAKIQDDDNSSKKISKENGRELTKIPHPKFEGEAKAGSKISVWNEKGQDKREMEVDEEGRWVLTDIRSQEGPNKLIFDITDLAGNTAQKTFDYTIDTIPPAVPSDISLAVFQTIDGTPTTASQNPTLTGKGEANSWVFIYLGKDSTPVGKTQVNPYGEWKYVFDKTLDPNLHDVRFTSRDGAGNVSKKAHFTFKIQTEMDVLEAQLSEQSRSGNKTEKWKTKNTDDLQIEGTAESGANITIRIIPKEGENNTFGPFETTVGSDKKWLINIGALPPGVYEVEMTSRNKLGQDALRKYLLTVKNFIETPQIEIDKDNVQVFQNSEGKHIINSRKPRFKIIGEAGSDLTIVLMNKKTGENEKIKERIPLNGVLFFSIKEDLKDGEYAINAILEDNLGNLSDPTDFSFDISTDMMTPTINLEEQTPWDESVIKENEGIINKRTFTLSGEATAGANIYLYKNGMRYGKMIRADDKTGKWKYDVTVDKDSQYEFFAKAEFNGLSKDSLPLQVTVDTQIESLRVELEKEPRLNEGYTKKTRPTFLVTVPKDVKEIRLYHGNKLLNTKMLKQLPDENGKVVWTLMLDEDLSVGDNNIRFIAIDHATNTKNFDYTVHVLKTLQLPEMAFDGNTKTGTSDDFTNNNTPGFILRNIKKQGAQNPDVKVIINRTDGTLIDEITAQYDENQNQWNAVANKSLSEDHYTATVEVLYPDSKDKVTSNPFDFNIKTRVLDPIIEPYQQDFMKFQDKWLTTKKDPRFHIRFETAAIDSVTINVLDSSGKVIKTQTLNENELQRLQGEYDYTLVPFKSNDYQLQVMVIDKAGNQRIKKESFHINTDAVEPVSIELIDHGHTKDFTNVSKPEMKFTPNGKNITKITVEIKGDNGDSKTYELTTKEFEKNWKLRDAFTAEGKYTVTATAHRSNEKSHPETLDIHFYKNAPDIGSIQLDSNPEGFTNDLTPRLLITLKPEDVHRAWKIKIVIKDANGVQHGDPIWVNNITGPSFYATIDKPLSNGSYTVEATLIDKAKNENQSPATTQIYFNNIPPQPEIAFEDNVVRTGKNIIDNQNRKFVITSKKGTKPITKKDVVEVTVTDNDGTGSTEYSNEKDPTLFHYDEIKGRWVLDLISQNVSPQNNFTVTAKVSDQYGNKGTSEDFLFTIVDQVITPEIELVSKTAYDGVSNITKEKNPSFKLKDIDPNATEVIISITGVGVGVGVDNTVIINDKSRIKLQDLLQNPNKSFNLDQNWTINGKYTLTVTTHVDGKSSVPHSIEVEFDDQLTSPSIELDDARHQGASNAIISFRNPKFKLSDIEKDVKKVKLTIYDGKNQKYIEFDPNDTRENLAKKGITKVAGGYTYQPTTDWNDQQEYTLTLNVTDHAKNEKNAEFKITIDTTVPAVPKMALGDQDNHSFDKKKNITKNKNPYFTLSDIDSTKIKSIEIKVYDEKRQELPELAQTLNPGDKGFYLALGDNIHQKLIIEAKAIALSGKESPPDILEVTVDNKEVPQPVLELVTKDPGSQITNKKTPEFKLTLIDKDRLDWDNPGSILLTFTDKNGDRQSQIITQRQVETGTFTLDRDLQDGEYKDFKVEIIYQAGQTISSDPQEVTVYTTTPEPIISFLDDSLDTSAISNKNEMKFKIRLNNSDALPGGEAAKEKSRVSVFLKDDKGQRIGQPVDATYDPGEDAWIAIFPPGTGAKGTITAVANITDPYGNTGASAPFEFTVITGVKKPILELEESGHTPSDPEEYPNKNEKITNRKTLSFKISDVDPYATVVELKIYIQKNGKRAEKGTIQYKKNEAGSWEPRTNITLDDDDRYELVLEVSNAHDTGRSDSLYVTVDTHLNPPTIALKDDTGPDEIPLINKKPTIEILFNETDLRKISVDYQIDGVLTTYTFILNQNGDVKPSSNEGKLKKIQGGYEFTLPAAVQAENGTHEIKVTLTDHASNEKASDTLTLKIDTTKPDTPQIALDAQSDTTHDKSSAEKWTHKNPPQFMIHVGRENTDNPVTEVTVTVTAPGVPKRHYPATKDPNGEWRFTPDSTTWNKEGLYKLSVETENQAGSKSSSSTELQVHFHNRLPQKPSLGVDPADITGKDTSKNLTKNKNPKWIIKDIDLIADKIDQKAIKIDIVGPTGQLVSGGTVLHDAAKGTFYYEYGGTLSDGEYTATVTVTNKAGLNEISDEFKIEVDTTPPTQPIIELPEGANGSFIEHNGKKIAKHGANKLQFLFEIDQDIAQGDISVQLGGKALPGTLSNTGNGFWEFEVNKKHFKPGEDHQLSVTVEDKAGNTSQAGTSPEFRVIANLQAPTVEMTNSTSLDKINHAYLTQNPIAEFKITMQGIDKKDIKAVSVRLDNGQWQPAGYAQDSWSYSTSRQTEGKHTLEVKVTDILGETSEQTLDFEVDLTLNLPTLFICDSDGNVTKDQRKTKEAQPFFKVEVPGDIYMLRVNVGGKLLSYTREDIQDLINGGLPTDKGMEKAFIFQLPLEHQLINHQAYNITVMVADRAGNTKNNWMTIEKVPVEVAQLPYVTLDSTTDSGTKGDSKTNSEHPILIVHNPNQKIEGTFTLTIQEIGADGKPKGKPINVSERTLPAHDKISVELGKNGSHLADGRYNITGTFTYEGGQTSIVSTADLIIDRQKPKNIEDLSYVLEGNQLYITGRKTKGMQVLIEGTFMQISTSTEEELNKTAFKIPVAWDGKEKELEVSLVEPEFDNHSTKTPLQLVIPQTPQDVVAESIEVPGNSFSFKMTGTINGAERVELRLGESGELLETVTVSKNGSFNIDISTGLATGLAYGTKFTVTGINKGIRGKSHQILLGLGDIKYDIDQDNHKVIVTGYALANSWVEITNKKNHKLGKVKTRPDGTFKMDTDLSDFIYEEYTVRVTDVNDKELVDGHYISKPDNMLFYYKESDTLLRVILPQAEMDKIGNVRSIIGATVRGNVISVGETKTEKNLDLDLTYKSNYYFTVKMYYGKIELIGYLPAGFRAVEISKEVFEKLKNNSLQPKFRSMETEEILGDVEEDEKTPTSSEEQLKVRPTSAKETMAKGHAEFKKDTQPQTPEADKVPLTKENATVPQDKEEVSTGSTDQGLLPKPSVELLDTLDTEKTVTNNPKPAFTLIAPKDMPDAIKAEVTLDGITHSEVPLIDKKGSFAVGMPLEDGAHELLVKFINAKGESKEESDTFTVDTSTDGILGSMAPPMKSQDEASKASHSAAELKEKPFDLALSPPDMAYHPNEMEEYY